MHSTLDRFLRSSLAALILAAAPLSAQFTDEEVARRPELEKILVEARVIAGEQLPKSEGVTLPYKLKISHDGVEYTALWKNPSGRMGGFWEGWEYEIAAYLLDKHMGLNMVPATVEREYEGKRGSIQIWADYWISGREKQEKKIAVPPANLNHWNRMTYLQRAFDNLIGNEDRHLGNILVTKDWRVLLIDHSRSFRTGKRYTKKLEYGDDKPMKSLPRGFVEALRALDAETLGSVVGGYLKQQEMEAVLARRALMLEAIDREIAARGEAAVLYN